MDTKALAPLIVIVGETASGKSDLAMHLALKYDGEIIAADSRTIYKGADIGTAKPGQSEVSLVKHYLLDMVEPGQTYNVARFQADVNWAVAQIVARRKIPIMVGGSGLYVDSVIFNYSFKSSPKGLSKESIDKMTLADLQGHALNELGIKESQINLRNRRHLEQAARRGRAASQDRVLRQNTLVLGVSREKKDIEKRIEERVKAMFYKGFLAEVALLTQVYGEQAASSIGIGYSSAIECIKGNITEQEAISRFVADDKKLAKRQRTWFKRNKSVQWIHNNEQAEDIVTTFLSKK